MPMIDEDDLEIPEFLRADSRDPVGKAVEKIEAAEAETVELPELEAGDADPMPIDEIDQGKDGEVEEDDEPENPRAKPGSNSRRKGPAQIAKEQLKAIVERVEKLEEEKAAIAGDIKEVYAEAKANGYDTKVLRGVIRDRKRDKAEREETEALRDLYMFALGMD